MPGRPMVMRIGIVAVALALPLLLGSGCSLKWTFIQLSYPTPVPDPSAVPTTDDVPTSDLAYTTYASLMPLMLVDYDRPTAVGQCLAAISGDAAMRRAIREYGLARATAPPADWYAPDLDLARLDYVWSPWPLGCPAEELGDADQARLAAALASAGETMIQVLLGSSGGLRPSVEHLQPRIADLDRGLSDALGTSARLLGADPAVAWGGDTKRAEYPSLVLSGGAGNGAFAAGYVYQLLTMREEALRLSAGSMPEVHQKIRDDARFGSLASTSVGALIAVAVDLYYAENGAEVPAPGEDWALGRPRQTGALDLLRKGFVVDEWDLFRVCRGNVFSLINVPGDPVPWDSQQGVLRFDPLMKGVLVPLFQEHGDALLGNDLIRVTTAVEVEKNALLFLDERACRLVEGKTRQDCLVTAVKASISEPALSPPIPRVYSGLTYLGEEGTWLDGGLRSGAPTSSGANYNREWGRVLAINTHRYQGVPEDGFDNAVQLLARTVTTFTEQTRSWELAYAQLMDEARHASRCRVEEHLGLENLRDRPCIRFYEDQRIAASSAGTDPGTAPMTPDKPSPMDHLAAHAQPPPPPGATWLRAVYVPDEVDMTLSAEGYAFDSQALAGLWLEGRRAFLATSDDVVRWLGPGWRQLATSDPRLRTIPGFDEFVAGERQEVENAWTLWHAAWLASTPDERAISHRKLLREKLRPCKCGPESCVEP